MKILWTRRDGVFMEIPSAFVWDRHAKETFTGRQAPLRAGGSGLVFALRSSSQNVCVTGILPGRERCGRGNSRTQSHRRAIGMWDAVNRPAVGPSLADGPPGPATGSAHKARPYRLSSACRAGPRVRAATDAVQCGITEDFSHRETNQRLGEEPHYPEAVERFMASLDEEAVAAMFADRSGGPPPPAVSPPPSGGAVRKE